MRDKNGRFAKKTDIIINIPSFFSLIKYFIIIIIFAPWLHLLIFKFDTISIIEDTLSYLFGSNDVTNCKCPETPY